VITSAAAKALLDDLASAPRPAGSPEESRAREVVAAHLRASGFSPHESTFSYSALPGLWGTSVIGGLLLLFWLIVWVGAREWNPGAVSTFFYIGLVVILVVAWWLMSHGITHLPFMRRAGINLFASPEGDGAPQRPLWLVAHIDSKWQPVSIWVRAVGVVVEVATALATIAYFVASALMGAESSELLQTYAIFGMLGTLPLILSFVGHRSPGALDNATGVAAVLLAVRELGADENIGVAITSAEELGLAGAIAWAREASPSRAINCDTADDRGELYAMWGRRRGLVDLVESGAVEELDARTRHIPLGILVDGYALDRRGWDTITIARGNRSTLRRIHTSSDRPERLTGEGSAEAARFIVALVRSASQE
jgi:hypothetical protein